MRQLKGSEDCNEAKRHVYLSDGVDWVVARGSQAVKRASKGCHETIGFV